jgi:hypothetical protein
MLLFHNSICETLKSEITALRIYKTESKLYHVYLGIMINFMIVQKVDSFSCFFFSVTLKA